MRIYHFINAEYGIQAILRRRLKVSLIPDLNDPFELIGSCLQDKDLRIAFQSTKRDLARRCGIHCFSKNWSNPVLWSHYADRHRGICLGFDVPDKSLMHVSYNGSRLKQDIRQMPLGSSKRAALMQKLLSFKFEDWKYESEVRIFVDLLETTHDNNLYFTEFSADFKLTQVILGPNCTLKRADLHSALGDLTEFVKNFKARLAFESFKVVRNLDEALWK
jgi:hypothetical protein